MEEHVAVRLVGLRVVQEEVWVAGVTVAVAWEEPVARPANV